MKLIFSVLLFLFPFSAYSQEVHVCLFDSGAGDQHEAQVKATVQSYLHKKTKAKIISYPIYNSAGDFSYDYMLKQIKTAQSQCQIFHFSWNVKYESAYDPIINLLNSLNLSEQVIVAAAGAPNKDQISEPLQQTVMGHVSQALIIGELSKKGQLVTNSYYGNEMLTALLPPKDHAGSSYSSAIFTAELANHFYTQKNWSKALKSTKSKSQNLWPSLRELFKK